MTRDCRGTLIIPVLPYAFFFLGRGGRIAASETIDVASNITCHQYILIILEIYSIKSYFAQLCSLGLYC